MIRLRPALAAFAVLLAAAPLSAQQTIYQWKDARGVTHYTDTPPAGAHKARPIRHQAIPVASPPKAQPAEDTRCRDARANVERLQGAEPVGFDGDGDGKPDRALTGQERADQLEFNRAAAKALCRRGD